MVSDDLGQGREGQSRAGQLNIVKNINTAATNHSQFSQKSVLCCTWPILGYLSESTVQSHAVQSSKYSPLS